MHTSENVGVLSDLGSEGSMICEQNVPDAVRRVQHVPEEVESLRASVRVESERSSELEQTSSAHHLGADVVARSTQQAEELQELARRVATRELLRAEVGLRTRVRVALDREGDQLGTRTDEFSALVRGHELVHHLQALEL